MRESEPVVRLVYQDADRMALLDSPTVCVKPVQIFQSKDLLLVSQPDVMRQWLESTFGGA
jgi:hypothetical protein